MPLALLRTRALAGLDAPEVTVEAHCAGGLPGMTLVGLPETAVKESRDRVRAALLAAGFSIPPSRFTLNLAPADLPKDGTRFDLAIAMAILAVTGQVDASTLDDYELIGELSLSGRLRHVPGALPTALKVREQGRVLVLPRESLEEASLIRDARLLPVEHISDLVAHLNGRQTLAEHEPTPRRPSCGGGPDLGEVRGQHRARRALEIAAAGGHNLLMIGPPGSGKSMLAQRLPGILPTMTEQEALEAAAVASISSLGFHVKQFGTRPFRAPHHSASSVALIGGGSNPKPGEVSLSHRGVLFLDELPEFDRKVLEVLREPLETGHITISRAARQADFPARFQLVAAMNPAPNGMDEQSPEAIRYRARISAPLLDRIDIHLEVPRIPAAELRADRDFQAETSAVVRERVEAARARMRQRQQAANAHLDTAGINAHCRLAEHDARLLEQAMEKLKLSARGRDRILKVARSIADLDGAADIDRDHLTEALSYRGLERLFRY